MTPSDPPAPSPGGRLWPVLHLRWPGTAGPVLPELLAAALDDFHPAAIEEHDRSAQVRAADVDARPVWSVYFDTSRARNAARQALEAGFGGQGLSIEAQDRDDENWAQRSQASLRAVRVGGFIVAPPWDLPVDVPPGHELIEIEPSTGFGTGHHATTRLCLQALRQVRVAGAQVVDVGTGSGVLAIAAARLGAAQVWAIDVDADALASARDNVARNESRSGASDLSRRIQFLLGDVRDHRALGHVPAADVVLANLTGAQLERDADRLWALATSGGVLVASGFQLDEPVASGTGAHPDAPGGGARIVATLHEETWGCVILRAPKVGRS